MVLAGIIFAALMTIVLNTREDTFRDTLAQCFFFTLDSRWNEIEFSPENGHQGGISCKK